MKDHLKTEKGYGLELDLAYMVRIETGESANHPTKRGVRGVSRVHCPVLTVAARVHDHHVRSA